MRHALVGLLIATSCERPSHVVRAAELTVEQVEGIERGVVLLEATWSMPAMEVQDRLLAQLAAEPVTILIVPSDAPSLARFGLGPTGAGEQLWVHHGRICFACAGPACVERGVRWLRDPRGTCPQTFVFPPPYP